MAASTAFSSIFFADRVLGEERNLVAGNLGEAATDREERDGSALGHAEFAVLDLREQRDVTGQNADLTVHRRDHDGVDGVGINPAPRA